ncbi:myelin transcription factor 1 [Telopea speciosissima]|uniref:myelin transcription factor 1 n=1 Tax=Telopea speciosissima TaxID=54955 RepID=UPI001CC4F5E1|nr:myelin transcription factor 1 [Telopea speciosissima]
MGGCATKPKVLKGDDDFAPEPAPAKEPETAPVTTKEGYEAKEGVNGEEAKGITTHEEGDKIEVGIEEKVGEEKPRSLSNLFEESEQEKESSGNGDETINNEENPNIETTATSPRSTAELKSSRVIDTASEEKPVTTAADVQTGKTDKTDEIEQEEKETSRNIGETNQTVVLPLDPVLKHEENPKIGMITTTTAPPPPAADELESTPVFVDAASEEQSLTAADQRGKQENYQKEKRKEEESVSNAKDVKMMDKAENDDQIQEKTVLTAASATVGVAESPATKDFK